MPARCPHEAGLQASGEPPSHEAYKAKPESDWHSAQDAWLAKFSGGKSTLPSPGEPGSAESKARAQAWRAAINRHGRAKRMAAAVAGDAEANYVLNGLAGVAHTRHAIKHGWLNNNAAWHPRPRGPAPHGFEWNHDQGIWIGTDGTTPRPDATRSQRRVQQRKASEVQTLRHKRKWQLYSSSERQRRRRKGEELALTVQERKAHNAGWRLAVLSPDLYAKMGYDAEADRALRDSMGDVMAAKVSTRVHQSSEYSEHSAA
jgi:hypothetical protein